jgi:solute carrier family 25 (mitochondrial thiamine pyrophosphate transporter), member 19
VIAPLDVVKIRLQLQSRPQLPTALDGVSRAPNGALSTFRHIVANEGITGLWKGNIPAELMYVSYSAVQFTTYRSTTLLLDRLLAPRHRLSRSAESFLAGATAGATATAATYPLDLLRTRFAAQGKDRIYSSLAKAVGDIRRDEGLRGFFRGLAPALGQIMPYMGIFFASYEGLRASLANLDLPFGGGDAAAGVVASVTAKTAVFPLDLVRKRIQVQGPTRKRYVQKDIPEYRGGAVRALRTILATEGPRGLYRGLTVSLLKAAPASAVTMWTYERALGFLASMEPDMD